MDRNAKNANKTSTAQQRRRQTLAVATDTRRPDALEEAERRRANSSLENGLTSALRNLTLDDFLYRRFFNVEAKRLQLTSLVISPRNSPRNANSIFAAASRAASSSSAKKAPVESKKKAVVVTDPFSTGLCVAKEVSDRGYEVICVWSDTTEMMKELAARVPDALKVKYAKVIYHDGAKPKEQALSETVRSLLRLPFEIIACIPGAETGVILNDILAERLGLRGNGTAQSEARRNKYLMGETVRDAGLRAVNQKLARTWSDVQEFLDNWNPQPFRVVVKPVNSAGSDDVFKCTSVDEVREAFGCIMGKINGLGLSNEAVLVQEFLEGTEYVVDTVSVDGEHKVIAVWEYDKREVNGSAFVYFGTWLRSSEYGPIAKIIDYQLKVLTALGVKNGPAHAELKFVKGEPCLVEVGSRCHGNCGAFIPIVNKCIGYNQVTAAVSAYLDRPKWTALPSRPGTLHYHAATCQLVNYQEGLVDKVNKDKVSSLTSFVEDDIHPHQGEKLPITVDLFTSPGSVQLVHKELRQLQADYDKIHQLTKDGALFEVKAALAVKHEQEYVAVVDPFSTGAVLAAQLSERGYHVICVYSDTLEKMKSLASMIPAGLTLTYHAIIDHRGDITDTATRLKRLGVTISAVLPGAETGVLVCDKLCQELGVRGNPLNLSEARRNKYLMGEAVRNAGLRAVKQKRCLSLDDVEVFMKEHNPSPFKIVVKPPESAGTDDVILCQSPDEVRAAFKRMLGKTNGLGIKNTFILLQEYLEGVMLAMHNT